MRYALNVAPINGWETHLGQGVAALAADATGVATPAAQGGGVAPIMLDGAALGNMRQVLYGAAQLGVDAYGFGRIAGPGGLGLIGLDAMGAAKLIAKPTASSQIDIGAAGDSKIAMLLSGAGRIDLTGSGLLEAAMLGSGIGSIELSGSGDARTHHPVYGGGRADILSNATGRAVTIGKNSGAASITMEAQGLGRLGAHAYGAGAAQVVMDGRGVPRSYRVIYAGGSAVMSLSAAHQITATISGPFEPAPIERQLFVEDDSRTLVVSSDGDRVPGGQVLPRYSDGTIALDLILDAGRYGEASTTGAIDRLDQIVGADMPNNSWGNP
ncbi:virion-associated phage protein [Ralstonia phage GP4]|uniref:Virion-associated phage protein n=2 Tax=root TaxID=1 RepID=A0A345GU10_9CAUD|nr:virion structural protein [Ralstonia phage GP4]AXG67774.1 virion-associated phage protein [Ralstonia phage GP4]